MSEYLLRQRLAQCHQENRPVDGMEPDDILTDQVQVCWPQLLVPVSYTHLDVYKRQLPVRAMPAAL